ncbi:tRNA glutamyl-Q(34) synthetase GluQRS [Marinomonas pollencensis]|uniref:Glutamyl-Q tRNA(Asp) synthetase n=1 Tax=Marinomonas pollencensis TaxID=491954 RepID=A0A3E0DID3_9GAMM|nr:tRNA glutamyl-Q(34) synthetase GluQRS [Marinomonas pollencensis]REG82455.1 glutamyl-Q tRNA(Asp) synthetase [Marinomonas pollencensis]
MISSGYRGRFAPSPTGPLHLGSLVAALASYVDAKYHQGTWIVRIEDVDAVRCRPEYTQQILATLESYQLISDEAVRLQYEHTASYEAYLTQLKQSQNVFPCNCTRKSLQAYSGLHPHVCQSTETQPHSWRLRTNHEEYHYQDLIQGAMSFADDLDGNHPVLKRKDGYFSYQLAVVVDDHLQGITHLIRGADLIDTTAQQLHLYHLFGWQVPQIGHIPLVVNQDAEKISKQNHAKPIPNGDLDTLIRALSYLKIDAQNATSITEALAVAIQNWKPQRLSQQTTTVIAPKDLHFL